MKRIVIAAAAVSIVVAPMSVAPAHAAPPTYCGLATYEMTPEQFKVCSGGMDKPAGLVPPGAPLPSTGYPDCDAYTLPTNRAMCMDQHAAGLR
jgi:hypothetical protein